MGSKKRTYHKERIFTTNYFIFFENLIIITLTINLIISLIIVNLSIITSYK